MSDSERQDEVEQRGARGPDAGALDAEQRGSFLGFVAHEMRNPLSTALWSAELLVRLPASERAGARGDKLAGMCLRSLQRLRHLVEDHFLSERLEVGGIPLKLEAVPLGPVVEAVAAKVQGNALTVELDAGLAAWTDRGLAERALEGMVSVAGKGQVPVRVEGRRQGRRSELRVHGATPVSEALDRPRKGTASDPSGLALALHMASQVATRLGGTLTTLPDGYCLSLPQPGDESGVETP